MSHFHCTGAIFLPSSLPALGVPNPSGIADGAWLRLPALERNLPELSRFGRWPRYSVIGSVPSGSTLWGIGPGARIAGGCATLIARLGRERGALTFAVWDLLRRVLCGVSFRDGCCLAFVADP
jgi:hypothetical protein